VRRPRYTPDEDQFIRANYDVLTSDEIGRALGRPGRGILRRASDCLGLHKHQIGANGMLSDFPDLMLEWHPSMNLPLDPATITASSSRKVWWICSTDPSHVWDAIVANRTRGAACRYCSSNSPKVPLPCNSLRSRFPATADEWHPSENGDLTPELVSPGSNQMVTWRCSVDPTHIWRTTPNDRTGPKGSGCPHCSQAHESRIDITLRYELAALLGTVRDDRRIGVGPRPLVVDFADWDRRLVVEYDSAYHHDPAKGRMDFDQTKADTLRQLGWTVVRVREAPLRRLSRSDLRVHKGTNGKTLVIAVADHLASALGIKMTGLEGYKETPGLLRQDEIASYLRQCRTRTMLVCQHCGVEYYVKPSKRSASHYCSWECKWAAGRVTLRCEWCGGPIDTIRGKAEGKRFCSRSCVAKSNNAKRWGHE